MKRKYSTQFERLKIGATFCKNGNTCEKKSTRTAWINKERSMWFYFGGNEQVIITDLETLAY